MDITEIRKEIKFHNENIERSRKRLEQLYILLQIEKEKNNGQMELELI
jgi:hypothetical protein